MRLLNFNIIKLMLFLVMGILFAHYLDLDFEIRFALTTALIILVGVSAFYLQQKIDRTPYFGILVYLSMIAIGWTTYGLGEEKNRAEHYTHFQSDNKPQDLIISIRERLKPDAYNEKYIATVRAFNRNKALGKLLINIKKDSSSQDFDIDDVLYTSAVLQVIQKPLNPYQFDYSNYLQLKQIFHQVYLNADELKLLSNTPYSVYGYADALRTRINKNLVSAGFKSNTLSIINALLLGQRQDIDRSLYNNYINAGTIHILAVSGLHVGIILIILNFLLRPLLYLKNGRVLRPLIIVFLLWSFAVIAGLSPSVTRAVSMFSIISIAMHLKRPTNIYNTLVISAFIILLFKPRFLFEVGFQMSYLAVLGIVSIQPILYKFFQPKYWLVDKFWQIFTVTLAAQFGVVPISLYYFHQFPGLFFISNLVVIPFLGLILGLGLLVLALALANQLPEFLVLGYGWIIDTLNQFIAWVAQFEDFILRDISFSLAQVICSYFIIMALVQVYKYRNFKWFALALGSVITFQAINFYNRYAAEDDAFIIFNKSRFSIIGHKTARHLKIYHNLDSLKQKTDNVIRNYTVGASVNTIAKDSLQAVYQFKQDYILVIDSLGIYQGLSFIPNYVVLRNSPRFNLNRLIDSLKPEVIIADASNYKSYVRRWERTCKTRNVPFHATSEKGAFILKD